MSVYLVFTRCIFHLQRNYWKGRGGGKNDFYRKEWMAYGQGLQFVSKYYILHVFRTTTPFKEIPSDNFYNLHKLKHLENFGVNFRFQEGAKQKLVLPVKFFLLLRISSEESLFLFSLE